MSIRRSAVNGMTVALVVRMGLLIVGSPWCSAVEAGSSIVEPQRGEDRSDDLQPRGMPGRGPNRLSPAETAVLQGFGALRQELQRLDAALQNPSTPPSSSVTASMPQLEVLFRNLGSGVAAFKSQAAQGSDPRDLARARTYDQQMITLQQDIHALPGDAAGTDQALARKKTRNRLQHSDLVIKKVMDKASPVL